ncbi:hypothetical protein TRIUR3_14276 [Triticum urartu]|uniref:Uncharacterized protein n=1 Tax=Triticum urartu TaxID=4572 RepID=M7ZEK7_TRIUA|nr:hypothetical protein TRIUR3_14276 [Triticum urartu]
MSCPSQRIIRCRFNSVDSVIESRLQEAINGNGCERPADNCRFSDLDRLDLGFTVG